MKLKIKKGSTVEVIAGNEKGKRGVVLDVNVTKLKIRIQGIKIQTHFDKKDGLLTKEGYIDYSNVKLVQHVESVTKKVKAKKKVAAHQ